MQQLQPQAGEVKVGVEQFACLDQNTRFLDLEKSVLENFEHFNSDLNSTEVHRVLAQFLFKGDRARQRVSTLSGGERLRAALACCLMTKKPPQLLILDEPNNHLDLDSLATLEQVLRQYEGALLVVSHDRRFLSEIGVERFEVLDPTVKP